MVLNGNADCSEVMAQTQQKLLADKFDVVLTTASREHAGDADGYEEVWRPVAEAGTKILAVGDVPGVPVEDLHAPGRRGTDCSGRRPNR